MSNVKSIFIYLLAAQNIDKMQIYFHLTPALTRLDQPLNSYKSETAQRCVYCVQDCGDVWGDVSDSSGGMPIFPFYLYLTAKGRKVFRQK